MSVSSLGGGRYFVLFTDDYSGYTVIHIMKAKSRVFELFKQYVQRVEVKTGHLVNTLRSDNGEEFVGDNFGDWMKQKGIRNETSAPYTPQQKECQKERTEQSLKQPAAC